MFFQGEFAEHASIAILLVVCMFLFNNSKKPSSKNTPAVVKPTSPVNRAFSRSTTASSFSASPRQAQKPVPVYAQDTKASIVEVKPVVIAENETRKNLTIKNLPNKVTEEFMRAKVAAFTSNFDRVYMPLDKSTGRCKGFGFIHFTTSEDALAFMKAFDGMNFTGEMVNGVRLSTTKAMKVGFADVQ